MSAFVLFRLFGGREAECCVVHVCRMGDCGVCEEEGGVLLERGHEETRAMPRRVVAEWCVCVCVCDAVCV